MLNKVDLNLLAIALALYDELSVSRAAQALGMSQPAVNMALREMRATFNDPLFVRAPRGITPTPRAHALIAVARPLVSQLRQGLLAEETFNPGLSTRPFTFALSDVGEMAFLPNGHRAVGSRYDSAACARLVLFTAVRGPCHRAAAIRHRRLRLEAALASQVPQ